MPLILDYIAIGKAKNLLGQYSKFLKGTLLLLDTNKEVILKVPDDGDATNGELDTRPLYLRGLLLGFVAMEKGPTSSASLDFAAENLSAVIEMEFEIENLAEEVARNYEEFSLIWRLSSKLGPGLDTDKICGVLAEEVDRICPSTNVSIMLAVEMGSGAPVVSGALDSLQTFGQKGGQDNKSFFIPKISLGADASKASLMILGTDRGLLGEVYKSKKPLTVCDVPSDERFEGLPYPVTRILIVPLIVEDTVIGVIMANDKLDGEEYYTPEIKFLSSCASECAISIKKALLYDEIHDMLFKTAEAFSLAIDAKDPYTYGHSKRVSLLATEIARELGTSSEAIGWIKMAGLLHDIGKIGVPEEILNGAGKLDPDAMEKMKEHPTIGATMIEHIDKFKEVASWIRHHHEHYDGTGYPMSLKGEDIPLASRIITVADIFDALTSERSYRKALSKEEAMGMIRELRGSSIDPVVLDAFEKVLARMPAPTM